MGSPTSDIKEESGAETVVPEIVDEEVEAPSAVSAITPTGGLGETWQPSPIARMSEVEFDIRLEAMKTEKRRIARIKKAILEFDEAGDGSGDYGVIPGTKKPSLYQSGAETFNLFAKLRPVYRRNPIIGDGVTTPHFRIDVDCDLVDETGAIHGSGGGSANSWEEKYRYRNTGLVCPDCRVEAVRLSNFEPPGWYCWKKSEPEPGCGHIFELNDQRIATQKAGKVDHPNPYDLYNTIEQMADKRAFVKTTRTTHALSRIFTQGDGSDIPSDGPQDRDQSSHRDGSASQKINQATAKMITEKASEKAAENEGTTTAEVLRDVLGALEIPNIDEAPQTSVPEIVKAIWNWEPGGNA